jgi:hypothetical protein
MAVVPVIFSGVLYPKNKKDPPMPVTFVGNAAIAGLHVGGGPAEPPPPDSGGGPPLVIWGGPFEPPYVDAGPPGPQPHPEHPIYWPGFPDQPPPEVTPPPEFPGPGAIKPFPPQGGWGYSERTGWVFKPPAGTATPKK